LITGKGIIFPWYFLLFDIFIKAKIVRIKDTTESFPPLKEIHISSSLLKIEKYIRS
jgi:hypothetical protein